MRGLCYASAKLEKLTFCSACFYFGTTILKFDSFSLLYHIVRKWIAKVTASFSLYALSELVYTKKYFTLYIIPYLFTPSLFPFGVFWTETDWQNSSPFNPPSYFFTERVGPPAGATLLGWPNYGVEGRSNKQPILMILTKIREESQEKQEIRLCVVTHKS